MTQFICPFFSSESLGFELRYMLRSIDKNFQGDIDLIIIGERPTFLDESRYRFLDCARHGEIAPQTVNFDILRKFELLANHKIVAEKFVNMNDDFFMLKPFDEKWVEDLRHCVLDHYSTFSKLVITNNYTKAVSYTIDYLRTKKRPTWNHNLHMPRMLHKENLRKMFDEVPMISRRLHWETLYANTFLPENFDPKFLFKGDGRKAGFYGDDDDFSFIIKPHHTYENIKNCLKHYMMLNFDNRGYHPFLKQYLEETFPEPSSFEKKEDK